jgi:hypothetical protein
MRSTRDTKEQLKKCDSSPEKAPLTAAQRAFAEVLGLALAQQWTASQSTSTPSCDPMPPVDSDAAP